MAVCTDDPPTKVEAGLLPARAALQTSVSSSSSLEKSRELTTWFLMLAGFATAAEDDDVDPLLASGRRTELGTASEEEGFTAARAAGLSATT